MACVNAYNLTCIEEWIDKSIFCTPKSELKTLHFSADLRLNKLRRAFFKQIHKKIHIVKILVYTDPKA